MITMNTTKRQLSRIRKPEEGWGKVEYNTCPLAFFSPSIFRHGPWAPAWIRGISSAPIEYRAGSPLLRLCHCMHCQLLGSVIKWVESGNIGFFLSVLQRSMCTSLHRGITGTTCEALFQNGSRPKPPMISYSGFKASICAFQEALSEIFPLNNLARSGIIATCKNTNYLCECVISALGFLCSGGVNII